MSSFIDNDANVYRLILRAKQKHVLYRGFEIQRLMEKAKFLSVGPFVDKETRRDVQHL